MALNSRETSTLFSHLERLYEIGKSGVRSGVRVLTVADTDTIIRAPANRANVIKRLLAAQHGEEVWNTLVDDDPGLASRLALARIYDDRKRVVDEFEANLSENLTEEYWQKLLESNRWIFGSCYVGFIEERRVNLKSTLDHPLVGEDGCLEVVEIKRPDFPFWKLRRDGHLALYRNKYLVPSAELDGAISQGSNYILELERKMDSREWAKKHGGIYPLKPRYLVVHGRSTGWEDVELREFRLLNDRLHGISVITFDHLLSRAKQALELLQ